jgi:CheY-like chemotaxis protein
VARILAVDDEPDLLLLLEATLRRAGHDVIAATTGEAAVAAVRDLRPALVVLDLALPGADGWSVLAQLRAHECEHVRATPVVMLTATNAAEAQARGAIEGAVCWLTKPVSVDRVLGAVEDALREPVEAQRQRARHRALRTIARIEGGAPDPAEDPPPHPHPRFAGLERRADPPPRLQGQSARDGTNGLQRLTARQRTVLTMVGRTPTIQAAAKALGVNRSSLYATIRRAAQRLGLPSASALIEQVRQSERAERAPEREP